MKKSGFVSLSIASIMLTGFLAGCGSSTSSGSFDTYSAITVCSREDGSGTRGAFIELFGIEQEENGEKVDKTTSSANITNSTNVMMTTVSGDVNAIGYCSLGSLNNTVKALTVDGVEATVDNVLKGTYKIARPFNILTKDDISDAAKDFESYILSSDGQKIIEDEGYVPVSKEGAYKSGDASGKVTVAGSSSVGPVMQKLAEEYQKVNSNVNVEVQISDSSTGIQNAINGVCDIGMSSRDLKDDEKGVDSTQIAMDGIAVIVNNSNTLTDISKDDVMNIYTGTYTKWSDIIK